jgi:uncharacterized protein (TIGR03437 family)
MIAKIDPPANQRIDIGKVTRQPVSLKGAKEFRMRSLFCALTLAMFFTAAAYAQPQIGGGTCTTSTLSGIYYYLFGGNRLVGTQLVNYAELGRLQFDGQGNFTDNSVQSVGGVITVDPISGRYSIQSNCAGTLTVGTAVFGFQVTGNGLGMIISYSAQNSLIVGRAYRQTAGTGTIQCGTASLSGGYAYLLSGTLYQAGIVQSYTQTGTATGDGAGNLSISGTINANGSTITTAATGHYSVSTDCSGTASVTNQAGTANYIIAVAGDGQVLLFLSSDPGYVLAGNAEPIFGAPQSAVVNSASFDWRALSPGAIFSIFGQNLPQSIASAQVFVNGQKAPVFYASSGQINAQIPYEAPTNQPVSLTVSGGGPQSNTVLLNLHPTGPGIFFYNGNHGVVQNSDYSVNSPTNPAHVGDFVVAYLAGGGAVNPALPTGVFAPSSPLSNVSAPYTFTIGGVQAKVPFFGLTPGFLGLYQANLQVPALNAGDYPLVANVGGVASNGPIISIR